MWAAPFLALVFFGFFGNLNGPHYIGLRIPNIGEHTVIVVPSFRQLYILWRPTNPNAEGSIFPDSHTQTWIQVNQPNVESYHSISPYFQIMACNHSLNYTIFLTINQSLSQLSQFLIHILVFQLYKNESNLNCKHYKFHNQ